MRISPNENNYISSADYQVRPKEDKHRPKCTPAPIVTNIKIDPTLTKSGWAADARVTGGVVRRAQEIVDNGEQEIQGIISEAESAMQQQVEAAQQSAQDASSAAGRAEAATVHQPIIGDNGNWYIWNQTTEQYIDSGSPSRPQYQVVQSISDLPPVGVEGIIYLVPTGDQENIYDEYIWVVNQYDILGSHVDLTGYATEQWVEAKDYIQNHNQDYEEISFGVYDEDTETLSSIFLNKSTASIDCADEANVKLSIVKLQHGEVELHTSQDGVGSTTQKLELDKITSVVEDNNGAQSTLEQTFNDIKFNGESLLQKLAPVTYGTTTFAAVTTLISAGKIPYVNYEGKLYIYQDNSNANIYVFSSTNFSGNGAISSVYLRNNDVWSSHTTAVETSVTDNDNHIPTSGAVVDYVAAEQKLVEVTYGVTTYYEVISILDDGKVPYLIYNDVFYKYTGDNGNEVVFTTTGSNLFYYVHVTTSNTWYNSMTSLSTSINSENMQHNRFPSNKAVADYVLQENKLVEVTYGTTTFSDISTLLSSGKIPYYYHNAIRFEYQFTDTNFHYFAALYGAGQFTLAFEYIRTNDTWSQWYAGSNQSISSASTNAGFPTSKAVYDFVIGAVPTNTSDLTNDSGYVTQLDVETYAQPKTITGSADPTTSTVGHVGQTYVNTTSTPNRAFICLSTAGGIYVWNRITYQQAENQIGYIYPSAEAQVG